MHTQTHHRHMVALPLFALCMLAVAGSDKLLVASALNTGATETAFIKTDVTAQIWTDETCGTRVMVQPKSILSVRHDSDSARVVLGSATVETATYANIQLDDTLQASILRGAAFALRDDRSVSLVALTAPLYALSGSQEFLVPRGYQLTASIKADGTLTTPLVSPVPLAWLTQVLDGLPATSPVVSVSDDADIVHFVAAGKYTEATQTLNAQTDAMTPHKYCQAMSALLSQVSQEDAHTQFGIALVRKITGSQTADMLTYLLLARERQLGDTVDTLASLSLKPAFDIPVALSIQQEALAMNRPLPGAFVDVWKKAALRAAALDPGAVTYGVLPIAKTIVSRFEQDGFPIYTRLWRGAVDDVTSFAGSLLSSVPKPIIKTTMQTAPHTSAHPCSENQARAALQAAGAMFTTKTSIRCLDTGLISAKGIYFSTSSGDHVFDFTFDVVSGTASGIVRDGTALPNSVPLKQIAH